MKLKHAITLLLGSLLLSTWLYWGDELKLERILTSKEWQTSMVTEITVPTHNENIGPLRQVSVTSNVKYLPNGNYIRVSMVKLSSTQSERDVLINISEAGTWEISDNYLLVSPSEFKDISSAQSLDFSQNQLKLITQLFKMDAQQSRRIDVVNKKTLLLTSLNHGSTILSSY